MGFGRTKSQSPKRSARSNLGEIPRYFRLQQMFPISSSSSPHGPDLSACVLNSQVTSGFAVIRPRIDFDRLPQRRWQAGILSRNNRGLTGVAEITAGGGGS